MKIPCSLLSPLFALSLVAVTPAFAQPATNITNDRSGALQVVSPEVAADRSITFRLYAPNAKAVFFNGDFFPEGSQGQAMTKADNGVWSLTMPPQPPSIMGYYFRVDGVRLTDPSNLLISSSAEFLKSYVEVPGDGPQFWSVRDVPHGQLHEVWYRNPALGQRHAMIYTPPGYDAASAKTYPAIYLLHSTTDNETFWSHVARANFIVDNLLADGKAKPVLLVMVFGHTSVPRGPEEGAGGTDLYDVAVIGQDIVGQVIPLVEKEFHAGKTARDRAIFGCTMGGYQAVTIGMNYAGTFGYVAGASSNFRTNTNLATNFAGLTAKLETAKRDLAYVALMTGTGESGSYAQSRRVTEYFTGLGLRNEWMTPPGGQHTWQSWRAFFRDLVERKFFAADPYAAPPVGAVSAVKP